MDEEEEDFEDYDNYYDEELASDWQACSCGAHYCETCNDYCTCTCPVE